MAHLKTHQGPSELGVFHLDLQERQHAPANQEQPAYGK
jgi:hypothetical protein